MHNALSVDSPNSDIEPVVFGASDTGLGEQLFVARQPILDRGGQIIAYELLYRRADTLCAEVLNGNQATSQLLLAAFLEFGLGNLTQRLPAFVNVTEEWLNSAELESLPSKEVVLEILESVPMADPTVHQRLRQLREQGYIIALDDFALDEHNGRAAANADIVKVDVQAVDIDQLGDQVRRLRRYGCKLLAEKVETQRQFDDCLELGFDYFQGYYFLRPQVLGQRRLPACRHHVLKLLATVNNPHSTLSALGNLVQRDVTLSYRVLKYINSALCGFNGRITSIQHAVLLIGLRRLQQLTSLIVLAGIDDKPASLLETSLVRAKMCEEVARRLNMADQDQAFCVGLLSTLDAFFDQPMEQVATTLGLAQDLVDALVCGTGPLGRILGVSVSFEGGRWECLSDPDLDGEVLQEAYFHALSWADRARALYRTDS